MVLPGETKGNDEKVYAWLPVSGPRLESRTSRLWIRSGENPLTFLWSAGEAQDFTLDRRTCYCDWHFSRFNSDLPSE